MESERWETSGCFENGTAHVKRWALPDHGSWHGQRGDRILLQWRVDKCDKVFVILQSEQEENSSLHCVKEWKRLYWNCMKFLCFY